MYVHNGVYIVCTWREHQASIEGIETVAASLIGVLGHGMNSYPPKKYELSGQGRSRERWFVGQVTFYSVPWRGRFNVEIQYSDGKFDQDLDARLYAPTGDAGSVPGSWCLLSKEG